jgi:hypothetical protein
VNVIVVADEDTTNEAGELDESIGQQFLTGIIGEGEYLETRYDDPDFARGAAYLNGTYDRDRDLFVPPDPGDGSTYDPETNTWISEAPLVPPDET